jgi:hypothetical protein
VEWLARWMVAVHYRHHLTSTNVCFDPTQEAMLRRSEGPQSALHVEMCMLQHLLLSALGVGCRSRPFAAFHRYFPMLRCGPSKPPFAQGAAF